MPSANKMEFEMNEFKPRSMAAHPVVLIIGPRNTGKSFLIRDLLWHRQDVPIGTVISGSEVGNGFYRQMVPRMLIQDEFDPNTLRKVIRRQKMLLRKRERENFKADARAFVVLDDLNADSSKWIKDVYVRRLFMQGRHFHLTAMVACQYALGVGPDMRGQAEYVFVLRNTGVKERKVIYDNFAGFVPTFKMFCAIMDAVTVDHQVLVIDRTSNSNRFEDLLFWYKARDHAPFRLCAPELWVGNDDYTSSSSDDDDTRMMSEAARRNQRVRVRIRRDG
jgi:hypothetical protein